MKCYNSFGKKKEVIGRKNHAVRGSNITLVIGRKQNFINDVKVY